MLSAIALVAALCSGNAFADIEGNIALILDNPSDKYNMFEVTNTTNVDNVWHHTSPEAIMMKAHLPGTGIVRPKIVEATVIAKHNKKCWCKLTALLVADCPAMKICTPNWSQLKVVNGVAGPFCKAGGFDGKKNANFNADSDNCKSNSK